jgi:hypothetical protein
LQRHSGSIEAVQLDERASPLRQPENHPAIQPANKRGQISDRAFIRAYTRD